MSFTDFTAYFKSKSLDVLSNGHFKRHMTQCKENGDSWAIDMHCKQNKVHQIIKQLHSKIHSIGNSNLGIACKNVTNCAQPPIRIFIGFSTCFLTNLQSDKCVDLSKNSKKTQEIHIHPKFAYFFLFLWYICKLEYVIRACAKHWNERHNPQFSKKRTSIDHELCDLFMEKNADLCQNLFRIFERAVSYVNMSLDMYAEECAVKPILNPALYK